MLKDYEALYALQDEALALTFEEPLGFYLSGGTALSRFYLGHRYSDDLDFFTHELGLFGDAFRLVAGKLSARWPGLEIEIDARDFKRVRIATGSVDLKIDFVADRIPRVGLPLARGALVVDTVRNILSNKICAVLDRDEGRDVADLAAISLARRFNWKAALADAATKERFELEELLFRLQTFPVAALRAVPFAKPDTAERYAGVLPDLVRDLGRGGMNSLAQAGAPELS